MRVFRLLLAWILAIAALTMVACAWAGGLSGTIDGFASLLPLALPLAVLAVPIAPRGARTALALAMLISSGAALGRIVPEWGAALPPDGPGVRIVIETHNLRGGGVDPARQAHALATSGADVLLLQEARHRAPGVLKALARAYPFRSDCPDCELAILSRLPMGQVHWRLPDRAGAYVGPPLYRAEVAVPGGGTITVLTLHAPWPLPPASQAAFRLSLINAIRMQDSDRYVLAGDFNLTPWGDGMRGLDAGLSPLRRITRARFSFPALLADRSWSLPLLPLDQIFIGRAFRVVEVRTMPPTGSDHLPIQVTLHVMPQ